MTDISREACYKIVARLNWYAKLHGSQRNHSRRADYQNEADIIIALRAALDRQAVVALDHMRFERDIARAEIRRWENAAIRTGAKP